MAGKYAVYYLNDKQKTRYLKGNGFFVLWMERELLANYRNITATELAFGLKFYHAIGQGK